MENGERIIVGLFIAMENGLNNPQFRSRRRIIRLESVEYDNRAEVEIQTKRNKRQNDFIT